MSKESQLDGEDNARVGLVSALNLKNVSFPLQSAVDTLDHSGIGVGVSQYARLAIAGRQGSLQVDLFMMWLSCALFLSVVMTWRIGCPSLQKTRRTLRFLTC